MPGGTIFTRGQFYTRDQIARAVGGGNLQWYLPCDTLQGLKPRSFFLHRDEPTVVGLTVPPEAFNVSVCPTATGEMLRTCRTWLSPDKQQHAHNLKPFTRPRLPGRNRQGLVLNVQGANTCTHYTALESEKQ